MFIDRNCITCASTSMGRLMLVATEVSLEFHYHVAEEIFFLRELTITLLTVFIHGKINQQKWGTVL